MSKFRVLLSAEHNGSVVELGEYDMSRQDHIADLGEFSIDALTEMGNYTHEIARQNGELVRIEETVNINGSFRVITMLPDGEYTTELVHEIEQLNGDVVRIQA